VNFTGSKIMERETKSGNVVNMNLSSLSKGTYIMLFYTDQGYAGSKKLIKN
jgi:hypothetical protein